MISLYVCQLKIKTQHFTNFEFILEKNRIYYPHPPQIVHFHCTVPGCPSTAS